MLVNNNNHYRAVTDTSPHQEGLHYFSLRKPTLLLIEKAYTTPHWGGLHYSFRNGHWIKTRLFLNPLLFSLFKLYTVGTRCVGSVLQFLRSKSERFDVCGWYCADRAYGVQRMIANAEVYCDNWNLKAWINIKLWF